MMASGIALLVFAVQAAPAAATSSIVRAVLTDSRPLGISDCSPDPNAICQDMLFEAQIRVVDQLAGPRIRSGTTVRYISHLDMPRGRRLWLQLAPGQLPYRRAQQLEPAGSADRHEVCLDANGLRSFGAAPAGGTMRGDNLCFRRR